MPIGKDSITKRVAKTEVTQEPEINSESKNEEKPVTTPKKRTSAKKPAVKTSSETNNEIKTTDVQSNVLANVDPETVEKVIGHKEGSDSKKVSIGDDMPFYLM